VIGLGKTFQALIHEQGQTFDACLANKGSLRQTLFIYQSYARKKEKLRKQQKAPHIN